MSRRVTARVARQSCLSREESCSGATMPTRSAFGLQDQDPRLPAEAYRQAAPYSSNQLKGGSHSLALAQLGGNNARISGIWKWSSCMDRLGPQPSTPTPELLCSDSALSHQLLIKPGKQEAE